MIKYDYEKITQNNNFSTVKLLLFLSIVYLVLIAGTNGFLALMPFVREEFALTRTQVGYYSTFFYMSAAVLAIFTGNFVDKLGTRKGLLFGVLLLGAMLLLYGFVPTYNILLLLALLAGLGWSIITPSINKVLMLEVPPKKRATSMGIMQSGIGVGGFIGASMLPVMAASYDWRVTVQVTSLFALIMGFLILKYYKKIAINNTEKPGEQAGEKKSTTLKESLWLLSKDKNFIGLCMVGVLFGASANAVISHYTVFLSDDIAVNRTVTGVMLGVFQVGGIFGRLGWGWCSDKLFHGNRWRTLFVNGLVIGFIYLIYGMFINSPGINLAVIVLFSFFLGYSSWGWIGVFFTATGEIAGEEKTGVATGVTLMFTRFGQTAAPPIFGFIADLYGNYSFSWIMFGSVIILATIIFYLFSKRSESQT